MLVFPALWEAKVEGSLSPPEVQDPISIYENNLTMAEHGGSRL